MDVEPGVNRVVKALFLLAPTAALRRAEHENWEKGALGGVLFTLLRQRPSSVLPLEQFACYYPQCLQL